MPDVFTQAKRSEVMSRIRSRGNKDTELALARLFRRQKIKGWRRQVQLRVANEELRTRVGRPTEKIRNSKFEIRHFKVRPDFVFLKLRVAVLVDGCFWHCCPKHSNMPANNRAFWKRKLASNQRRDRLVSRTLRAQGWRVLRVWEHELARKNQARLVRRIQRTLND